MNINRLQAKIQARNLANASILKFAPRILAALQPLVGEMLRTKDGIRSAKLQKAVGALDLPNMQAGTPSLQIIVRADTYWFRAEFIARVGGDFGSVTDTQTVNLGEMEGRTLKSIADAPTAACHRTDYTVTEILDARIEVDAAKDALRVAERKLCFFGESDN